MFSGMIIGLGILVGLGVGEPKADAAETGKSRTFEFTYAATVTGVPAGETVNTVAVSAVLIAYNWPKTNLDRYSRVQRFVEAFFPKIAEFQKPPRHVKWREVNLQATLPGWKRFDAAQAWLDQHASPDTNGNPSAAPEATGLRPAATSASLQSAGGAGQPLPDRSSALYQEFLKWRQARGR